MQNSGFRTRITSLYDSQTLPMAFCIQNSDFSTRIQVSIGLSYHLLFCAFTTVTLWPELIVSKGLRPHLWFCACKTAWLAPGLLVSMCPRHHLSFCACKATRIATESLVSMCPSPQLWFLHAIQRLYDQTYKSLWVPDLTYGLLHSKQRI